MAKTLSSIEQQLDDVKSGKTFQVLLDPQTFWDRLTTGLLLVLIYFSITLALRWRSWNEPQEWVGAGLVVLVALTLLSFNEFWVVDYRQQRLKQFRSVFRVRWLRTAYDFSELRQIGVGGRSRRPKNGGLYWEYGLFLASRGKLLELFPALSTNYKSVVDLTTRLSQELGAPMLEPRPFGRIAYSSEKGGLGYTSGQDVSAVEDRMEANIHGDLTPIFSSPPRELPREEVRNLGQQRLEFEKSQPQAAQRGCAAFALLFVGPWLLMPAALLFEPGIGKKIVGLLLSAPMLAVVYYLVDWMLFPILRQYEFVDGQARQLGIVQVRGGGRTRVTSFDVPPGARVVNLEKVGRKELNHRIAIFEGETMIYLLDAAHSSQTTKEKAEQIAAVLGLPLETRSDLDPVTG